MKRTNIITSIQIVLMAIFGVKILQGALLLTDLPGVPDVSHDEALRSLGLAVICVGLLAWRRGIVTYSTCAAVATLSLASNAAEMSPLGWSLFSIATSAAALAIIASEVERTIRRRHTPHDTGTGTGTIADPTPIDITPTRT